MKYFVIFLILIVGVSSIAVSYGTVLPRHPDDLQKCLNGEFYEYDWCKNYRIEQKYNDINENYEFCKDPICTIQYLNGTTKTLSCNDDFSDFEDIGMKVSDNCKVEYDNLPSFDYAKFSKTLHFNRCTVDSNCFGTFSNGTQIKIQCENRVYHGCGPISFDTYQPVLTLKQQLTDKIDLDDIVCHNSEHVLTERSNGKIACVYQTTAEKFEWHIYYPIEMPVISFFKIIKENETFEVNYEIKNGKVIDMINNSKDNSLIINIDSSKDGQVILHIPHGVIDPIPKYSGDNWLFVLINGEEVESEQIVDDELNRTVTINFNHIDPQIEIIAAYWL